jgi:hypothetical protein
MAYSDSTHFSDKISYKILFISSYGLEDMILARFEHVQQFFRKTAKRQDVSHLGRGNASG